MLLQGFILANMLALVNVFWMFLKADGTEFLIQTYTTCRDTRLLLESLPKAKGRAHE